jgi:hypothetical protein
MARAVSKGLTSFSISLKRMPYHRQFSMLQPSPQLKSLGKRFRQRQNFLLLKLHWILTSPSKVYALLFKLIFG